MISRLTSVLSLSTWDYPRSTRIRHIVMIGLMLTSLVLPFIADRSLAATATSASVDGVKITTAGTVNAPVSAANVSVRRVSTGAVNSSTANPFIFNALQAITGGEHYTVSVSPVTTSNGYRVKGATWCSDPCSGFNPQSTNLRLGSSLDFVFSPGVSYHLRWLFEPVPTPLPRTPLPLPPVSLAPEPVATPIPTPTPPPAPAAVPVTAPSAFTASSEGTRPVVALRWTAAPGAKTYVLERSVDQVAWTVLSGDLATSDYLDQSPAFGIRYFYRLKAIDPIGTSSDYVTADATTPPFVANVTAGRDTDVTSDDRKVTVTILSGALDKEAVCQVASVKLETKLMAGNRLESGPFEISCRTSTGETVKNYAKPVIWSYALPKNGPQDRPFIAYAGQPGKTATVQTMTTSVPAARTLTFASPGNAITYVLSTNAAMPVTTYLIIGGAVLGTLLLLIALFLVRLPVKRSYDEYIRSKYYDL